jgi:hypothetical protein
MTEDAPDWLMHENKDWKGNRLIRFCNEGWQLTILGDEDGRNVYNSIDPSPLYRLIELGFDGIYLDRVDVYSEITGECSNGARKMVDFIARLGTHARKRNPQFMVILQNAEAPSQDDGDDRRRRQGEPIPWLGGDNGENCDRFACSSRRRRPGRRARRGLSEQGVEGRAVTKKSGAGLRATSRRTFAIVVTRPELLTMPPRDAQRQHG